MQYGLLSLILVQLLIAGGCFYAYLRQRNLSDVEKHDKLSFSARLEAAVGNADSARKMVEMIEVTHYKALFAKYETAMVEISQLRAQVKAQEESIASLSNKLASRERQDRAAAKKAAALPSGEDDGEVPSGAGAPDLDSLLRAHGVPMAQQPAAPAAKPSSFGKTAR